MTRSPSLVLVGNRLSSRAESGTLQAPVDRVWLLGDMPNAFGMGSVAMGVEADVEKIQQPLSQSTRQNHRLLPVRFPWAGA